MILFSNNRLGFATLCSSPKRIMRVMCYVTLLLVPCFVTASPKQDKIKQAVDAIKAAHYCEDEDYHTDGQRTVWVKSYKRWTPDDFKVMKKESPVVLKFLNQAVQHNRLDVLEQLLPDYYRSRGGVKAFAADIQRIRQ